MKNLRFSNILLFGLACIALSSCYPQLKLQKVKLSDAGFFVYEKNSNLYALRMEDGRLVHRDSLRFFIAEIANQDMRYLVESRSEVPVFFRSDEKALVNIYSNVRQCIEDQRYVDGLAISNQFLLLYPAAYKYTDIAYLKAYLYEKMSAPDSAKVYYTKFLQYSEKRLSGYFRGYSNTNLLDTAFIAERNNALVFLKKGAAIAENRPDYAPMPHKYYYQSFSQGFVLNQEDFGIMKKNLYGLSLAYNDVKGLQFGLGTTWLYRDNFIAYAGFMTWQNLMQFKLSTSFQVYKSANNDLGLKLSPALTFSTSMGAGSDSSHLYQINPGCAFSAGYRINQRVYAGASVSVYLYNQFTHNYFDKSIYDDNEYDISPYYQLMRGISLKAGIYNNYPVVGFGFTGSFLGYFFKNKSIGVSLSNY